MGKQNLLIKVVVIRLLFPAVFVEIRRNTVSDSYIVIPVKYTFFVVVGSKASTTPAMKKGIIVSSILTRRLISVSPQRDVAVSQSSDSG